MSTIDELPAGLDLDALVAEKVMGWRRCEDTMGNPMWDTMVPWTTKHGVEGLEPWNPERGVPPTHKISVYEFRPSTHISCAWMVVHKLKDIGDRFELSYRWSENKSVPEDHPTAYVRIWEAIFQIKKSGASDSAEASTETEAICRAALKALDNKT